MNFGAQYEFCETLCSILTTSPPCSASIIESPQGDIAMWNIVGGSPRSLAKDTRSLVCNYATVASRARHAMMVN